MSRTTIVAPGRNAWKTPTPDDCGLIVDAKDYYVAFYRAALEASRYILLSGWQFSRLVPLLRDEDLVYAEPAAGQVQLLKFLSYLCETKPGLEIYLLAWDFHIAFALEREWMQKIYFHWGTHERVHFQFDASHLPGGCHHQKFAIIDGTHAFLGGIDLCECRWDDRQHLATHPSREHKGEAQKPYHDIQAYFSGREVNHVLIDLFTERWKRAGADPINLPRDVPVAASMPWPPRGALPLPAQNVAISRTDPQTDPQQSVHEVRFLLEDAIAAAECLIYMENQYFSSRRLREAFEARMRAPGRPMLEIVLVINQDAEAFKEEVAVGLRQSENIAHLRKVAAETGHQLGVFYTVAEGTATNEKGDVVEVATYIHSKLSIVDDEFLCMGSANLTNRSMDLDTELNASWETASQADAKFKRAVRRVRVSLLAEHMGAEAADLRSLLRIQGLVDYLSNHKGRLRAVPPLSAEEAQVLEIVDPQGLPFDPETSIEEAEGRHQRSLFRLGLPELWDRLIDTVAGSKPKDK